MIRRGRWVVVAIARRPPNELVRIATAIEPHSVVFADRGAGTIVRVPKR